MYSISIKYDIVLHFIFAVCIISFAFVQIVYCSIRILVSTEDILIYWIMVEVLGRSLSRYWCPKQWGSGGQIGRRVKSEEAAEGASDGE